MSNHELNYSVSKEELVRNDCYSDRATIEKITDLEGEVMQADAISLGIHCEGEYPILLPCNLPEAYQQTGLKVRFSGCVKDVGSSELLAGQPFVLTQLQKCL